MLAIDKSVREVENCRPDAIPQEILGSMEPVVLKGLVKDWPAVHAGKQSPEQATNYIRQYYNGAPVTAYRGEPQIKGRVFYNEGFTGFNFERTNAMLDEFCDALLEHQGDSEPPTYYVGSTLIDKWLPGFRDANDLVLTSLKPLVSIWLGNQSHISAHQDVPTNIACVVAGRRRFTLFPPEQLDNLYIGPLDLTPSGLPISLVDFSDPDFDRFPRFREALKSAQVAELESGDALLLPSMWWHHVTSLESVNILVNYWWRTTPGYMGTPSNVLQHALLGLRDLPVEQRQVWQHIFDYYVFNPEVHAFEHIPEHVRGALDGVDDVSARRIRALLLAKLNQ